jgi:protease-4
MEDESGLRRILALADRRRIAVIPLRGVIGGATRTGDLLRMLGAARRDDNVRGVLLVIDSPGGNATESEALFVAVSKLAERKPVVAWIQSTGASGAYFAACGAQRILAFPSAIVGSIGVISIRPVMVEALRRLGAGVTVTKTGPLKDTGAFWREPTAADDAKERALVDAIFGRFTAAVAGARGFDDARLRAVTTGEVWLGAEAVDLGLVDGLAVDEEEAIEAARQLARLPRGRVTRMGPRRTVGQRLGLPFAGMGPPGPRWIAELEGWARAPQVRL